MTRRKIYAKAMDRTLTFRLPAPLAHEVRVYRVDVSRVCRDAIFDAVQKAKAIARARRGGKERSP